MRQLKVTSDNTADFEARRDLLHHSYPTLSDYIEHMNRYSSLGAEMAVGRGTHRIQRHQHRDPALVHVCLQLFFPSGFSRRT